VPVTNTSGGASGIVGTRSRLTRYATQSPPAHTPGPRILNVGTGVGTNLLEVIEALDAVAGKRGSIRSLPARAGDIRRSCADIGRARNTLGFRPQWTFRDGIAATVGTA